MKANFYFFESTFLLDYKADQIMICKETHLYYYIYHIVYNTVLYLYIKSYLTCDRRCIHINK